MRRLLFFFFLTASLLQAQTQIGNDIAGQFNFDFMGWDVAISDNGQTIVAGASNYSVNADSAGQVKVFQFDGSDWIQIGSDLLGAAEGDNFGRSVDISGDGTIIVVGAHVSDLGGFNSGAVQVFEFNGTDWVQKGNTLTGSNADDEFGSFVAISNDGNRVFRLDLVEAHQLVVVCIQDQELLMMVMAV
ncbi:MAG: FG-GAP repeat protein [Psychroserpens sp.]|nr:FG-GAP repeat protein [Psychroserpens sp.]